MFFGYLSCSFSYSSCLVIRDISIASVSTNMCFFLHKSLYVSISEMCMSIDVRLFFVQVFACQKRKTCKNFVQHIHCSNVNSLSQRVYSQVIRLLDLGVSFSLKIFSSCRRCCNRQVCAWVTVSKRRSHSTRIWKPLECAQRSSSRTGHGTRANSRVKKLARPAILLHPVHAWLENPYKMYHCQSCFFILENK